MTESSRPALFVEHFFRTQWRNTIASLTARFGIANLEEVENAVQVAMLKALERWALSGVPASPDRWLYVTARNELIDTMRRKRRFGEKREQVIEAWYVREDDFVHDPSPLQDDVLKLMFACCNPVVARRNRIILTLRMVSGLGFHEIASALYLSEAAVRKALTRCRKGIVAKPFAFELPPRAERFERLGSVLEIVYLVFNEGYFASRGSRVTRIELCTEAQRLTALLRESELNEDPRLQALSALMAFQSSRLSTRSDPRGRVLRLDEQDRSRWDEAQIHEGFRFLETSMAGGYRSRYHLEAAIAACHASATSFEQTDWPRILSYYDDLLELTSSPVIEMNRAVAVMMVEGPHAALSILKRLAKRSVFDESALLPSLMAECYKRLGEHQRAAELYQRSIELSQNTMLAEFWTQVSRDPDPRLQRPSS